MAEYYITVSELKDFAEKLQCGDKVYLSGTIYTARDAAHARLVRLIEEGALLPFELDGAVIYYAGPTPTHSDGRIGSYGPTTSARMDSFTPLLLNKGLLGIIGKGDRSKSVIDSLRDNKSVYFCACGGLGALISKSIKQVTEIAFSELGCESIKQLIVEDMPLITAVDSKGISIFDR